jgi:hypothetical protein
MSGSEEETYSIMFSSLRHPARRKILRMLSERTMTFSQMLEELAIPSSHLTYHLENLGELVIKDDKGKYTLSSFGNASVSMMKGAEEVPDVHAKHFSTLPLRWKSLYAVFIIAIVLLASMSFVQYVSFNSLSSDYGVLKTNLTEVQAQNQKLLSWSPSTNQAMIIIRNVIQIDVSKYQATLESTTAQVRSDLGGAIEEVFKYSLVNSQSNFELTLRFRNGHFSLYQLSQLEGFPNYPPLYTQPQPTNVLQASTRLIQRYKAVMNDSYLDEGTRLLASANDTSNDQTLGNTKLRLSTYGTSSDALLMYTDNGTDFPPKSQDVVFENNVVTKFSDDWVLYQVGSTQVNISKEQAVLIAKNAAKTFSWNSNGTQISDFQILDNPVTVQLVSHAKGLESLTLYPYWYVTLFLDKTYPGGVSVIAVGVWADTGKVEAIQALGGQVAP